MQNEKYLGRYRNRTIRLQSWDYGWNGYYFITICIKNRCEHFGKVDCGKMVLNRIGRIVNKCWFEIPYHFRNVKLDEFIVMPDHVHGILLMNNKPRRYAINRVPTGKQTNRVPTGKQTNRVPTGKQTNRVPTGISTNNRIGGITGNKNPMLYKNLSTIVRWYKGRCTFEISKNFAWQSRFWDHIIRNNDELERIRWYIKNNPVVRG